MTTETGDVLAVDLMALVAVHLGVSAGQGLQFRADSGMAGNTGGLDRFHRLQIHGQRAVRRMALGAATEIEVGISGRSVAGGAGDQGGNPRFRMLGMTVGATDAGMASVTVGTAHRRLVCSPLPIEISHLGGMTGGAESRGGIAGEIGEGRLVRRVAAQAVLVGHFRAMRSMTCEAGLGLAMLGMALVATQFRMVTGEFVGFPSRTFVTGNAGRPHVTQLAEILHHGSVGIVTIAAILHGEM